PAQVLPGRVADARDPAEQPPLLLLRRGAAVDREHHRRDPRVPFAGWVRNRARHDHPGDQRDPALGLHGVLPLLPAHHRWPAAGTSPSTRSATAPGVSCPSSTGSTWSWPGPLSAPWW